jgi:hypothetical protein
VTVQPSYTVGLASSDRDRNSSISSLSLTLSSLTSKDSMSTPALSLFVWEDGAPFDWLMNQYMTAEFPFPPDPTLDPLSQSD